MLEFMKTPSFEELVKSHLAEYRQEQMGIDEWGIYKNNGKKYGHIIPEERKLENILPSIRSSFEQYASQNKSGHKHLIEKLHINFHHLNSSQAMCFNLFFPLIEHNRYDLIADFLKIQVNAPVQGCFEKESEKEKDSPRRTNFDFFLNWPQCHEIYFEIKYTERYFGKADKDAEHRNKFQTVYKDLVEKSSNYLKGECHGEDFFLEHYQLLRNLVHVSPHSTVVFLFPFKNKSIYRQAKHAEAGLLTEEGKAKVRLVSLEDFIAHLKSSGFRRDYWEEFERKYLPDCLRNLARPDAC